MTTCRQGLTKIANAAVIIADTNYDIFIPCACEYDIQIIWSDGSGVPGDAGCELKNSTDGVHFNSIGAGDLQFDIDGSAGSHSIEDNMTGASFHRLEVNIGTMTTLTLNIYVSIKEK